MAPNMAEFLLEKGYEVYGLARRTSHDPFQRIQHLLGKIHVVNGDLADQSSLDQVFIDRKLDEVYNFAGDYVEAPN